VLLFYAGKENQVDVFSNGVAKLIILFLCMWPRTAYYLKEKKNLLNGLTKSKINKRLVLCFIIFTLVFQRWV
jgi:hypothetical protein